MSAITRANFTNDKMIGQYLQEIRHFPLLDAEKEAALAERYRDTRDPQLAEELVTSHLRLVVKMALAYKGYGLPVVDLVSEGSIGLLQAVKRFDPTRGFRLSTYAMWWIRAAIQEYILHNWSLVKIGTNAAQKKCFFNLRKLKQQIQAADGELSPSDVEALSKALDVPAAEVISMNRRLSGGDQSLNAVVNEDGRTEWLDVLVDDQDSQEAVLSDHEEAVQRRRWLKEAMSSLDDRERDIVTERYLKEVPTTFHELGHRYGLSGERIRQIEERAMKKLRRRAPAVMDLPMAA